MAKKFDYTKSTFYVTLTILLVVLFMASPYLTSIGQFQQGETLPVEPINIITVCKSGACDYTTIQAALNAAEDDYVVKIKDKNIYYEKIFINKKINLDCDGATISGKTFQYPTIITLTSSYSGVHNCKIADTGWVGIFSSGSSDLKYLKIRNNYFTKVTFGMELQGSLTNSLIDSNIMVGYYWAGHFLGVGGAAEGNTISNNIYQTAVGGNGILIGHQTADNYIIKNSMSSNGNLYASGLLMVGGVNNNNAQDNVIVGNSFGSGSVWIITNGNTNTVYHNNFNFNTTVRAYNLTPGQTITLDHGYPDGGNYWYYQTPKTDVYSGPNQDQPGSDSIVDTAYVNGTGIDHYPLTRTFTGAVNYPPRASFDYTSNYRTITFRDKSTDDSGIVTWNWDFGDGATSIEQNPTHEFAVGEHTVMLSVYDSEDYKSVYERTFTIGNLNPVPIISADKTVAYVDENITFDASGSYDLDGTVVSYEWIFGDEVGINPPPGGATIMAIAPITLPIEPPLGDIQSHSYSAPGTYTVTLTVTDNDGAKSTATTQITIEESSQPIIPNENPVAIISVDKTIVYTDETVTFDASGSYDTDGTIVSYEWIFGDEVGINPPPGGATIMAIAPITLPIEPPYIAYHSYLEPGVYTVKLTVTDDQGAVSTSTTQITVESIFIPITEPIVARMDPVAVISTDKTTAYVDETVVFDASGSYDLDGTVVSYEWIFGDEVGINPPPSNPTTMAIVPITNPVVPVYIAYHSYSEPGTYTVTLTVTDNERNTDTATTQIVVEALPQAVPAGTITVSAGSDKTIYVGDTTSFTGTVFCSDDSCNTISLYEWDFQNDTIIEWNATVGGNITSVLHTYTTVGRYVAMFRVFDNESNQFLDYALVNVLPAPEITPGLPGEGGLGGLQLPGFPRLPGQDGLIKNQSITVPPGGFAGNETGTEAAQTGEGNKQPFSVLLIDALIVLLFAGALGFIILKTRTKLGKTKENINKTDIE